MVPPETLPCLTSSKLPGKNLRTVLSNSYDCEDITRDNSATK